MYLVDTNVVSAGAPRRTGVAELVRWMDEHSASLYLSVVTAAELEDGIAKAHREKARRKAAEFRYMARSAFAPVRQSHPRL